MAKFKDRLGLIRAVIDAIQTSSETVDYPFAPLELPHGFRGAIMIEPEKCMGCGLCVRDCPAEALVLLKKSRQEFTLLHYPARCAYCGQCEDSCHRGAISHSNSLVSPTTDKKAIAVVLKDQKS